MQIFKKHSYSQYESFVSNFILIIFMTSIYVKGSNFYCEWSFEWERVEGGYEGRERSEKTNIRKG
jgi:hypothetical protein